MKVRTYRLIVICLIVLMIFPHVVKALHAVRVDVRTDDGKHNGTAATVASLMGPRTCSAGTALHRSHLISMLIGSSRDTQRTMLVIQTA